MINTTKTSSIIPAQIRLGIVCSPSGNRRLLEGPTAVGPSINVIPASVLTWGLVSPETLEIVPKTVIPVKMEVKVNLIIFISFVALFFNPVFFILKKRELACTCKCCISSLTLPFKIND